MIISNEAEQAVLGSILINPTLINSLPEIISAEMFGAAHNQKVFAAMVQLGVSSDVITVAEVLESQGADQPLSYLMDLQQGTHSTANAKAYAKVVAEKYQLRMLLEASQSIAELVSSETDTKAADVINKAQSLILGLSTDSEESGPVCAATALQTAVNEWNRRSKMNGQIDGLATGYRDIDKRLCGVRAGDLFIIAGRPSMGKTVFAMNIVSNAVIKQKKRAVVFSLEMSTQQLMDRMTAEVAGVDYSILRSCDSDAFGKAGPMINNGATLIKDAGTRLMIDETPGLHINQVLARARRQHAISPVDMVVVDHIGLLKAEGHSREREVADITGKLKVLAKELGCPVVALSQLNRGVEQRTCKRPMMSDLRDSGAIEQDADTVALLYRDDYYKTEGVEPDMSVEIIFGKLRDGEVGTDYLMNEMNKMRMVNAMEGYRPPEPKQEKAPPRGFS